jgi:hypothetical protein
MEDAEAPESLDSRQVAEPLRFPGFEGGFRVKAGDIPDALALAGAIDKGHAMDNGVPGRLECHTPVAG